jgi:hypothetical protein
MYGFTNIAKMEFTNYFVRTINGGDNSSGEFTAPVRDCESHPISLLFGIHPSLQTPSLC